MFDTMQTWAHDLAPDIAIQITKIMFQGPTHCWLTARLVNKNNPSIFYEHDTYCITNHHYKFWKRIT